MYSIVRFVCRTAESKMGSQWAKDNLQAKRDTIPSVGFLCRLVLRQEGPRSVRWISLLGRPFRLVRRDGASSFDVSMTTSELGRMHFLVAEAGQTQTFAFDINATWRSLHIITHQNLKEKQAEAGRVDVKKVHHTQTKHRQSYDLQSSFVISSIFIFISKSTSTWESSFLQGEKSVAFGVAASSCSNFNMSVIDMRWSDHLTSLLLGLRL